MVAIFSFTRSMTALAFSPERITTVPKGFKPLRVGVRLVPAGGAAVEQSFPWPEAVRSDEAG